MACASCSVTAGVSANAETVRNERVASATTSNFFLIIFLLPFRVPFRKIARRAGQLDLESVRRLQAGLQSFLSMRRIEARRKNASAFWLRHSQSLAKRRQRLSHAMVRSTIQRLGKTANPLI